MNANASMAIDTSSADRATDEFFRLLEKAGPQNRRKVVGLLLQLDSGFMTVALDRETQRKVLRPSAAFSRLIDTARAHATVAV